MNFPRSEGKILIVFSDPGGAKPLLALIEQMDLKEIKVVSDRLYPFYKDFRTQVEVIESHQIAGIIEEYNPTTIITGTSYTSDIERNTLEISGSKGIYSYSFIDHWTSILRRFESEDGTIILPDKIAVIDQRAKEMAIEQGINENRVITIGNPYQEWLKNWIPTISKDEWLQKVSLLNSKKSIFLFVPDPLSNINGLLKYGFDEFSVIETLITLCQDHEITTQWEILIKPHPNQNMDKLTRLLEGTNIRLLPLDTDTNEAIYFSDIICGFMSSILLEAAIMNKKIFRFLPVPLKTDPISHLELATVINTISKLKYELIRQRLFS